MIFLVTCGQAKAPKKGSGISGQSSPEVVVLVDISAGTSSAAASSSDSSSSASISSTGGEEIGDDTAEVIHNGEEFYVLNPLPRTCYYQLTNDANETVLVKHIRSETKDSVTQKHGCDSEEFGVSFCQSTIVNVKVFSDKNTI